MATHLAHAELGRKPISATSQHVRRREASASSPTRKVEARTVSDARRPPPPAPVYG